MQQHRRCEMGSNDPVLETVGLTHLGSPKALVGKRGGPLLREFREFALRGNLLDMAVHRHKGVSQYLVLQVPTTILTGQDRLPYAPLACEVNDLARRGNAAV
jgi:hypothetical protein